MGISTSSKASTKSRALRASKAPTTPRLVAKRRGKNRRGRLWSAGVARIARVVINAVSSTRGSVRPSRPRSKVRPSFGSQASCRSAGASRQQARPTSSWAAVLRAARLRTLAEAVVAGSSGRSRAATRGKPASRSSDRDGISEAGEGDRGMGCPGRRATRRPSAARRARG